MNSFMPKYLKPYYFVAIIYFKNGYSKSLLFARIIIIIIYLLGITYNHPPKNR